MPQMLSPEAARFELREGDPVLTLAVDPPAALVADDWGIMSRLTLVVVDGPGDLGFLLPRRTPDGDAAGGLGRGGRPGGRQSRRLRSRRGVRRHLRASHRLTVR